MKTSIPSVLIAFALVCFGLSPTAKALLPAPSPDGGYPGGNTAEGITHCTTSTPPLGSTIPPWVQMPLPTIPPALYNVGIGSGALTSNTTGNFNMAIGTEALTS